jgi:hypothetical protein
LNQLISLHTFQTASPCTELAGPTCQCPATMLLRSSVFLSHPIVDHRALLPHGLACQSHLGRVARAPPPSPVHWPASATDARCCRPHAAPPLLLPPPRGTPGPTPHPCLTLPPLQKPTAATRSFFSSFSCRPCSSSSSLPFSTA